MSGARDFCCTSFGISRRPGSRNGRRFGFEETRACEAVCPDAPKKLSSKAFRLKSASYMERSLLTNIGPRKKPPFSKELPQSMSKPFVTQKTSVTLAHLTHRSESLPSPKCSKAMQTAEHPTDSIAGPSAARASRTPVLTSTYGAYRAYTHHSRIDSTSFAKTRHIGHPSLVEGAKVGV